VAAAVVAIAGITLSGCGQGAGRPQSIGKVSVGAPAPDFTTQTLDGSLITLSRLRGRPVLINFWATWCTACQAEMPAIDQVWERHRNEGLAVLAIDYGESDRVALRQYLDGLGVKFGAGLDPGGKIANAYGVTFGLPVSFFVDRQGKVAAFRIGEMSPAFIDQQTQAIL
jgi:peroxiredoxin